MKHSSIIAGLVSGLLLCQAVAHPRQAQDYLSPDGAILVRVAPVSTKCAESRVEIWKKNVLLLRKKFGSPDCEHGMGVYRGGWTADSRFFVFNAQSSGGHMPWHYPVYFYSRRENRLYSLDGAVGPVVAPEIKLKPPHLVETRVLEQGNDAGRRVMFDLTRYPKSKRP